MEYKVVIQSTTKKKNSLQTLDGLPQMSPLHPLVITPNYVCAFFVGSCCCTKFELHSKQATNQYTV